MKERRLLKFPSDTKLRDKFFAKADKGHPARANLYMMMWLIKKLTKPGETILDPTSGIGTLLYATITGRNVINIELEKHFCDVQRLTWAFINMNHKPTGTFTLLEGDARRFLPVQADHCIFSPPYGVNISRGGKEIAAMAAEAGTFVGEYGQDKAQLSNLSYFNLTLAMREIFKGIFLSLPSKGFLSVITKDSVDTKNASFRGYGGRVPYTADTIKICHDVGFDFYELWAREAKPSLRLQVAWSQNPGIPHITTEDIIIVRKP